MRFRFAIRLLGVLGAFNAAACATLPAVPDQGGPAWFRLESTHFVLYTDQSDGDARDTLARLESLLSAYGQLGWDTKGELPVKLEVLVFDDSAEFGVFAGRTGGFYDRRAPLAPLMVMPRTNVLDRWSTLKHELTHFIAAQGMPFQPRWFAEGLACYFQTADFDRNDDFVIGDVPAGLHDALMALRILPARELLADPPGEDGLRFYASAWLLVHYLMSERGEAFATYQNGLFEGKSSNEAWTAAFPDLPVDRVDAALQRYLREGRFAKYTQPVKRVAMGAVGVRALRSADIYAFRARLYLACRDCSDEPAKDAAFNIQQALQREPNHLAASVLRYGSVPKDERMTYARGLVRAHPHTWLSYWVLATTELGGGTTPPRCSPLVVEKLSALGERAAYAVMMTATCQAAAGARREALELSTRALRMQPADALLLVLRATVLLAVHECDELQRLLPQLRNADHPPLEPELLASYAACKAA